MRHDFLAVRARQFLRDRATLTVRGLLCDGNTGPNAALDLIDKIMVLARDLGQEQLTSMAHECL